MTKRIPPELGMFVYNDFPSIVTNRLLGVECFLHSQSYSASQLNLPLKKVYFSLLVVEGLIWEKIEDNFYYRLYISWENPIYVQ